MKWFTNNCTYCTKLYRGRGKIYCSPYCRSQDWKGNRNPNYKGGHFKKCALCENKFWIQPSTKQITCSFSCRNKLDWKNNYTVMRERSIQSLQKTRPKTLFHKRSKFQQELFSIFKRYYYGRHITQDHPIKTKNGRTFYIDIAFPTNKFGIECDGEYWHNALYDNWRDSLLKKEGWTIWRIKMNNRKWKNLPGIQSMIQILKQESKSPSYTQ